MPRKRTLEEEAPNGAVAVAEPPELEAPAAEPPPRKRLSIDDYSRMSLWEAMTQMNDEDWSDKMLYVYRSAPFSVNKHTNQKYGAILKSGGPGITQEELQNNFGGGKFRLYLKKGKVTLADAIEIVNGKPKLLPDELLMTGSDDEPEAPASGADANSQMALEVIRQLLRERQEKATAAGDTEAASALAKGIELVASGAAEGQKLLLSGNKAPSLSEQFDMMQKLMVLAAPKEDKTTTLLLTKLLERAFPAQAAPAANPVDEVTRILETGKKLKELWGEGEAAATGDWKSALAGAIIQNIPQIATFLRQLANRPPQVIVMQPGPDGRMQAIPPRATPQTLETVPIDLGSAGVSPASGQDARAPEIAPAPNGATPTGPPTGADLLTGDALKLKVVTMFLKGNDGSLVASFIENAAPTVYAGLRQIDPQLFRGFLKSDPILSQISTEENFDEWCKEFLEFMHEGEEDGAPAKTPPADTPPPVQ